MLKLIEYAWDGSNFVNSGTLTLDPGPREIEKLVKVEWRSRHTGLYSIYPRCKYRFRRTIEFTLKGGCTPEKRKEIEFYATRYSKFKIDNSSWGDMISLTPYSTRTVYPADHPWPQTSEETLYVMFEETSFRLLEGKEWVEYSIKLKVVNNEGIQG